MRHTSSVSAAVLALLFTAACDSLDSPADPVSPDLAANRAAPQGRIHTPDHEFARAARAEVPGFAGYFLRSDGTPVIRLADGAQRGAAQRYLAQHLAAARRGRHAGAPQQPVFLPAAYDFAQLHKWSERLTPLLQREGIYLIDVDEVENRVLVGVGSASAGATVRAEAVRLGIPAAAVATQTQPKPENRATVRDRFTTQVGGIQIAFGNYVCTQGFNARRNPDA